MATIAQHNRSIDRVIDGITAELITGYAGLVTQLDTVLDNNTSTDITGIAVPLAVGVLALIDQLMPRVEGLLTEYADTVELSVDAPSFNTLVSATRSSIRAAVESDTKEIVTAAIIGVVIGNSLTQIRSNLRSVRDRASRAIGTIITESIMTAHGAFGYVIMRLAGITRFTYAGGTISTTRPFCQTHNNKTYTTQEIKTIWRGSWGGKRPGDPFVVRGGYNCRHYWVPVKGGSK
jgi:hypothetical protein